MTLVSVEKAKKKASVTKMIANGEHTYLTSRISKRLPVVDSDVTKTVGVPAGASRAVRMGQVEPRVKRRPK